MSYHTLMETLRMFNKLVLPVDVILHNSRINKPTQYSYCFFYYSDKLEK